MASPAPGSGRAPTANGSSTPATATAGTPGSGDENVELKDMVASKPPLPVEQDIMQLARLGEIGAIQKLFDTGDYDATYTDEQGITPLHVSSRLSYSYMRIYLLIPCSGPP
jgi:hypothetical protein